jgi:zinc transport system permease protein
MVLGAVAFSVLAVLAGLGVSVQLDTPAGPSIVLVLTALFGLTVPLLMRQGAR